MKLSLLVKGNECISQKNTQVIPKAHSSKSLSGHPFYEVRFMAYVCQSWEKSTLQRCAEENGNSFGKKTDRIRKTKDESNINWNPCRGVHVSALSRQGNPIRHP